jgi:phosphoglycolate phosphatase-like HAD superfamily hydrolase
LAFDIDGVVADTMGLFLDIARDEFGIDHLRYDDITTYALEDCLDLQTRQIEAIVEKLLGHEATGRLKPLDGAPEVVRRLADAAGSVLFVTARPSADAIEAWLHDLLKLPPAAVSVVATGSFDGKTEVLRNRGIHYFVEDRLETCFLMGASGISPIVYRQPWNRQPHPFAEVGNWEELASLIAL